MNIKALITTAIISATVGAMGAGVASAQVDRGQYGSNRNMWYVDGRVKDLIVQLNHDDRDYGGHRVNAINDLQAARNEIAAAEQFARQHGY
ncbi:MAG TPA: hypothetical protein VN905_16375 [Candidatus Binatia bacterium]|nr:hypothetical protein [Candidatus Binatia bacterium]